MAAFTDEVQLTVRVGSDVSQPDANQKLRAFMRDAVRALTGLLPQPPPTEIEIAAMTTTQARVHVQRAVRAFLRGAVKAQRVQAAVATHVDPVRLAPDESEEAP